MRTFKRSVPEIDADDIKNYNKYFNHMTFKGIVQDDNPYVIDQESLNSANNVYVDWEERLVSRPTLQDDEVPSQAQYVDYQLVDVRYIGEGTLYINYNSTTSHYIIVYYVSSTVYPTLQNLTNYHISSIDHYIICFNSGGAKILDLNNLTAGWQNFSTFVEVPVTKRVVGATETTYPANEFTSAHKTEYIWNNNSHPAIDPNGGIVSTTVTTDTGKVTYANSYEDYTIIKPINTKVSSYTASYSAVGNIICIGYNTCVDVSYNAGNTFTRYYYPANNGYITSSISEDGGYFFVVAINGVFRCELGNIENTWTRLPAYASDGTTIENIKGTSPAAEIKSIGKFKTKDLFTFVTSDSSGIYLYFYGPGLYSGTDYTKDNRLSYISSIGGSALNTLVTFNLSYLADNMDYYMDIYTTTDNNGREVGCIGAAFPYNGNTYNNIRFIFIYGGDTSTYTTSTSMYSQSNLVGNLGDIGAIRFMNIYNGKGIASNEWLGSDTLLFGGSFEAICSYWPNRSQPMSRNWYNVPIQIGYTTDGTNKHPYIYYSLRTIITSTGFPTSGINDVHLPLRLTDGYISGLYVLKFNSDNWQSLPITGFANDFTISNKGDDFYVIGRLTSTDAYSLWTNNFTDSDSAVITVTYSSSAEYTSVPTISYSGTQLFLGFDNVLKITNNTSSTTDGTTIAFNLSPINTQTFVDNINAIINISTTEVALFFLHKVKICTYVSDSNLDLGYRYDYSDTKLSTGVRYGDSVINTLEGTYTIFPTKRGLAIMSYQELMATNDQALEYVTDKVRHMWSDYYAASSKMRMIQWRNIIVFTNGTKELLLFNIESAAWWKWTLPVTTEIALTDQETLRVINTTLLIFTNKGVQNNKELLLNYFDFSKKTTLVQHPEYRINWYLTSQPLHMSAPNYYKNIRQIVFQFSNNDDKTSVVQNSMNAQIKLYRKRVTVRDPETIQFKIEDMRTFVKRFNYWKINEVQWGLANDADTSSPAKFELNGLSVKYEIGEEVR